MVQISRKEGERITRQRKLVLEELQKVCNHPTATQIHIMVSKRDPQIALATVYRSLDFLEERGLILKLKSKKQETRYDGNVGSHCHLICENCDEIIDIFDIKKIKILSKELKKSGFQPSFDHLELSGLCRKCKLKQQNK